MRVNRIARTTVIVMCILNLIDEAVQHGKPKTGEHNFYVTFIATVIELLLLGAGGFFG